MTKLILTCVSLIGLYFTASSQQTKTYSGSYEGGNATYSYFENENYERIYNGAFSYNNKTSYYDLNINGQYKNNKKEGQWKATTDKPYDYQETFICNYKNGNLNGECSYVRTNKKTKKVERKITAQFNNNIMVGAFNTMYNDEFNHFIIGYNLNEQGLIEGEYKTISYNKPDDYEDIRKYKKGIMFWQLLRSQSTGEIIKKIDRTSFVDYIISKIDTSTDILRLSLNKYEELEDNNYSNAKESNKRKINDLLNSFVNSAYNGDTTGAYKILNAPFNLENRSISYSGSQWDFLIALNFWDNRTEQYYGGQNNPLYKITYGANPTNHYPTNEISLNTTLHLAEFRDLKEWSYNNQKQLAEKKKEKELLEKYDTHITKGNEYFSNNKFDFAVIEYKNALKIKQDENISKQLEVAETKKAEQEKEELKQQELEKEKRRLEMLKREITKLESDIKLNHNKLLGNTSLTKKKKALNNSYLILYKKSNEIVDENEKLTHLKNLKLLQENINYLINLSSNSVEKQLKSVDNTDEIWKIIKANLKVSWY